MALLDSATGKLIRDYSIKELVEAANLMRGYDLVALCAAGSGSQSRESRSGESAMVRKRPDHLDCCRRRAGRQVRQPKPSDVLHHGRWRATRGRDGKTPNHEEMIQGLRELGLLDRIPYAGLLEHAERYREQALCRVSGTITGSPSLYGVPVITGAVGVRDRFGESGAPWELIKEFKVSAEHIAQMGVDLVKVRLAAVATGSLDKLTPSR